MEINAPYTRAISIHAPRGGSDALPPVKDLDSPYFNPRSPWGERPIWWQPPKHLVVISIHAPRGGSDPIDQLLALKKIISIHAPRGGSDDTIGESCFDLLCISIHAPRGGSDSKDVQFYLRILGEKVNFECYFLVNSRCQPVP